MSHNRVQATRGYCNAKRLPKGPNGRNLCRQCGTEVPKGRYTFCSDACVHEWTIRTSPAEVRRQVGARDHGVCARCGADTAKWQALFRKAPHHYGIREELAATLGLSARDIWRQSFWEAHHIVPVAEGGGECGLDGYETLCLICHRQETRRLARRLASARKQQGILLEV